MSFASSILLTYLYIISVNLCVSIYESVGPANCFHFINLVTILMAASAAS